MVANQISFFIPDPASRTAQNQRTALIPTGDYQPIVCTPEAFREMTNPRGSPLRRRVDFRNDLLPLLYAEMQVRYYVHSAFLRGGISPARWFEINFSRVGSPGPSLEPSTV